MLDLTMNPNQSPQSRRPRAFFPLSLALCAVWASACIGAATPPPLAGVPTQTLGVLVTLTPPATATPIASRTALPTFTFTPSITPIPPTLTNTPTVTPTPVISGIIASLQTVNVRNGPGETYPAFVALIPGTGVIVLGRNEDGTWYNIQMEDGSEGWVSARLLRLNEPPTAVPSATPSPDFTALALGTPLPTAILGGGTITPTPPRSAVTATPAGPITPVSTPEASATLNIPRIDTSALNATATALTSGFSVVSAPTTGGGAAGTAVVVGTTPVFNATPTFTPFVPGGVTVGNADTPAPAGTAAVSRGQDVLAYCTEFNETPPRNLAVGSSVDIFWGWYAKTPELLDQHLAAVVYEVRVNGVLLTNWRNYRSPVQLESDGNYHIYWYVPFDLTAAGTYEVTYRVSWDSAISDGYDTFGPGTRNPIQTGSCRFTVR
jgi:hypothetical protein